MMAGMAVILGKELRLEWRTRESLAAMIVFAVAVILLFAFAFNAGATQVRLFAPGLIWMTYFFTAVLGLLRSFGREQEMDAYDLLLSSPVDRGSLYLGKAAAFLLLLIVTQLVSLPLFVLFLDVPLGMGQVGLLPIFILTDIAIAAVGTLIAGLSLRTPQGNTLLPVLLFPLLTPILIAATRATGAAMAARPMQEWDMWLMLLFTYAVLFVIVGAFIFDYISEQ
jgi:heme exporter protein B